jgi:hypothetical protein
LSKTFLSIIQNLLIHRRMYRLNYLLAEICS